MSRPQLPTVLIVDGEDFVSKKLSRVLHEKGLKVLETLTWEGLKNVGYVVCFAEANVNLQRLLDFTNSEKARFLFVSSIDKGQNKEEIVSTYGSRLGLNWRIVRVGDVYGPDMLIDSNAVFKLLSDTVNHRRLKVSKKEITYPVFISDVVWGIEKSLFSAGTSGATISIAGEPTTTYDIAQTIANFAHGVIIEETNEDSAHRVGLVTAREGRHLISWEPHTSLYEGLHETLGWLEQKRETTLKVEVPQIVHKPEIEPESFWEKKEQKHKRPASKRRVFLILGGFLVFYFFIFPFIQYGLGLLNFKLASNKFSNKEYRDVQLWGKASGFWFENSQPGLELLGKIPLIGNLFEPYIEKNRVLTRASRVLELGGGAAFGFMELLTKILGTSTYEVAPVTNDLSSKISTLEQELAFLEAETQDLKNKSDVASYFSQNELSVLRSKLRSVSGVMGNLPLFLGEGRRRVYLVLVFDETELRPGGGFAPVYGLLTFDRGRLVSWEFQSTELADAQLTGQVEPPEQIKKHLKEKSWYLSDVAWSGDFPTVASKAAWFIDKQLQVKVSGVISIDTSYLQKLLEATGPLEVQSVGEVGHKNIYSIIQSTGDGGRATSLVYIVRAIFDKILKNPNDRQFEFLGKSILGLDEKHINPFLEGEAMDSLEGSGWGGAIGSTTCRWQGICVDDYLYVTEANLGMNKANFYLARSYNLDVSIASDEVLHRLTINLENKGGSTWPAGDYKSYFRAYLPAKSERIQGILVNPSTSSTEEVEVEFGAEKGKKTVGGFIVVPSGEKRQIVLSWAKFAPRAFQEYALLWQKQPGTNRDPVWITIAVPGLAPLETNPLPSLTSSGTIGYNMELERDLKINIKWR